MSSLFRNNRFDTPDRAAKNRIIAPTSILHFYNVPKMEDEEMEAIFTDRGAPAPNKVKWFPAKSDKSVSGLVEFDSVQEACESLVMINHTEIEGTNKKYPYRNLPEPKCLNLNCHWLQSRLSLVLPRGHDLHNTGSDEMATGHTGLSLHARPRQTGLSAVS